MQGSMVTASAGTKVSIVPIIQLSIDLGIAVGDYNSGASKNFHEITRLTLEYLNAVKEGVSAKQIKQDEIRDLFALVGQAWSVIEPKEKSEN
jgi:hypothetical protein